MQIKNEDLVCFVLATRGFNPIYGARPLKRIICQLVENPLSKLILANKYSKGDKIIIDVKDDEIVFEKAAAAR